MFLPPFASIFLTRIPMKPIQQHTYHKQRGESSTRSQLKSQEFDPQRFWTNLKHKKTRKIQLIGLREKLRENQWFPVDVPLSQPGEKSHGSSSGKSQVPLWIHRGRRRPRPRALRGDPGPQRRAAGGGVQLVISTAWSLDFTIKEFDFTMMVVDGMYESWWFENGFTRIHHFSST